MKQRITIIAASLLAIAAAGGALASEGRIGEERVVNDGDLSRYVHVEDVRTTDDGRVTGTIRNDTDRRLSDVRVRVTYDWLWKNERHPGAESPSFSEDVTLRSDIPPHGSRPFDFAPSEALPRRSDGRFVTRVDVDEVVQFPVASSAGSYDRGTSGSSDRGTTGSYDRGPSERGTTDRGGSDNTYDRGGGTSDRAPERGSDRGGDY